MSIAQKWGVGVSILTLLILLYILQPVLTPFFIAAFLAYIGDPLVNLLRRFKFSRTLAATLVFSFIMLIVAAALFSLIPLLGRQLNLLLKRLPDLLSWVEQFAAPWLNQHLGLSLSFDIASVKTTLTDHWHQAGNVALVIWTTLSHSSLAVLGWLANLIIIPVVTFYLLRDWDTVLDNAQQLLPRRIELKTKEIFREFDEVLGAFFRGQLFVMLGLVFIYWLGLALVGLDLAFLLGVTAGILAIVPYLGVIIGVVSAAIAAAIQFHDWLHVIYVIIVFGIGHLIEHTVLTPWLLGDRIGLHPVAVIFAILVGGHLFGFIGILLALPVAALIMVILRHVKKHYQQSELYS